MAYTNRDPDGFPEVDARLISFAMNHGLVVMAAICLSRAGEISFACATAQVPAVGETIQLQDGEDCIVRKVVYRTGKDPKTGCYCLIPNVLAEHEPRDRP